MLPLIIGGLCAAVSFAAGAITSHAAGEKDRQAAKHLEKVNADLINKRDALEKRYYELSDTSKDRVSDLQRKLAESELEKDALYLVVRLQNSLLLLMQAIDREPSFEVLFQFREAVNQTNAMLTHLEEDLIPIPKNYFSRNLTRAKLKVAKLGETLTEEQKLLLHQLLPTASEGSISCPSCCHQNAVMKNVPSLKCGGCGNLIDLINVQHKIQWNAKAVPSLAAG
ncbi:MAG: hypothetical protein KME10_27705 [Plectolyngbya sp. WJT66-NPBG17]|jgi:hypothetical protein|nr:hypothetical protein [Plectolyngbya sp. WJT66-NPBG17]